MLCGIIQLYIQNIFVFRIGITAAINGWYFILFDQIRPFPQVLFTGNCKQLWLPARFVALRQRAPAKWNARSARFPVVNWHGRSQSVPVFCFINLCFPLFGDPPYSTEPIPDFFNYLSLRGLPFLRRAVSGSLLTLTEVPLAISTG